MFAQIRQKFSAVKERLRAYNLDEHDKRLDEVLARATSDLVGQPDWSLNMEFVDVCNSNPT